MDGIDAGEIGKTEETFFEIGELGDDLFKFLIGEDTAVNAENEGEIVLTEGIYSLM